MCMLNKFINNKNEFKKMLILKKKFEQIVVNGI